MNQCVSWEVANKENKWHGRNMSRWPNEESTAYKAGQLELDPVKRAAIMIKLNELIVNNHVVIPLVARPGALP